MSRFSTPLFADDHCSYTASISLSLALFNLLPLPRLDGSEILEVLLASSSTASFSPILPLAGGGRGVKTCLSGEVTQQHNKMEHALTWTINTASALWGGRALCSSRLGPIRRRNDLVRRVVQVTIGGVAGLQVMATLYSQLR
jgi:membrane-associated protease RseP (regulator of RpoE activity)